MSVRIVLTTSQAEAVIIALDAFAAEIEASTAPDDVELVADLDAATGVIADALARPTIEQVAAEVQAFNAAQGNP